MTEQVLEKNDCSKCGAEIRPGTTFCYNCGGAIAGIGDSNGNSASVSAEPKFEKPAPALRSDSFENSGAIEKPVGLPLEGSPVIPRKPDARDKKLVIQKETNLKTAAALRKVRKPAVEKNREVVWETPQSSNQIWFVVVSLVLFLCAAIILFLALRLG